MGTSKRDGLAFKSTTPGPGTYNYASSTSPGPKYG